MPDRMNPIPEDNRILHTLREVLGYQTDEEKTLDLLMRYCSDASGRSLTEEERKKAEYILSTDPYWQKIFEELKNDYQRMVNSVGASEIPRLLTSAPRRGTADLFRIKLQQIIPIPSIRIAVGTIVLVAILYGAAAIVSSIVTPSTVPLAKLGQESLALRGEQNLPAEAVNALQSGRYEEAIDHLQALTHGRLDPETEATIHYLLGIALLHSAERSPLNLFSHYDHATVLDGMRYLQNALRISRTDDSRRDFQDACRFALGKASLMLGDVKKAESYFLQVNERNNPFRMPARIILSSLSR